jgi:hypothetical protein
MEKLKLDMAAAPKPMEQMARVTGLEPATSGVTGRHSNRLSYTRALTRTTEARYVVARWIKWFVAGCQAALNHFHGTAPQICGSARKLCKPLSGKRVFPCAGGLKCLNTRPGRAISSVGRALRLHRRCREFESLIAHHAKPLISLKTLDT